MLLLQLGPFSVARIQGRLLVKNSESILAFSPEIYIYKAPREPVFVIFYFGHNIVADKVNAIGFLY